MRRFGPGPYVLGFVRVQGLWGEGFPFDVPALSAIEELRLDVPVTLLAGENGAGKSTILELAAEAIGFAAQGGELERLGELPPVPRTVLRGALAPVLSSHKPRNGYYLRAESFFNVAEFVDSGDRYAPDLSLYGDVPLHRQSHGESFFAVMMHRFGCARFRNADLQHTHEFIFEDYFVAIGSGLHGVEAIGEPRFILPVKVKMTEQRQ